MWKIFFVLAALLYSTLVLAQSDTLDIADVASIEAYSKTRITSDQFNQGLISDPLRLIHGKVPGLSISRFDGNPNTPFDFVARGFNSLQGNQQPLVVVDGITAMSLEAVDPFDIAAITILRGPAATSLYGVQGGNGVIVIETYQPEKGKLNIRYHTQFERLSPDNTLELLNPREFVNQGGFDHGSSTNWFDEVTQSSWGMSQHLSLSSSTENTGYRASLTYRDRPGVMEGHGRSSINTGFGIFHTLFKDRVKLSLDMRHVVRDIENKPNQVFRNAIAYNPTAPIFDASSDVYGGYFENPDNFDFFNPVAIRDLNTDERQQNIIQLHGTVDWQIVKGLNLTNRIGQYRLRNNRNTYTSKFSFFGSGQLQNGIASRRTIETVRSVYESNLDYNQSFGGIDVSLKAGGMVQLTENTGFGVTVNNFQFDGFGFDNLNAAIDRRGIFADYESLKTKEEIQSVYASASLTSSLFQLSFNWRNDGYTGFGTNTKRGNYFGISGGFSLDELLTVPEDLSIQVLGSYGQMGNLPTSPYLSQELYNVVGLFDFPTGQFHTYGPGNLGNPDLGPEMVTTLEIGTRVSALEGRLNVDMSFYRQNHSDLLYEARIPITPFLSRDQWLNIGEVRTNGFEYAINYQFKIGEFNIHSSLVGVFYGKRLLENLGTEELIFPSISPSVPFRRTVLLEIGEEIGNYFGSVTTVDNNGLFEDRDFNNDGRVDLSDERIIGNALPESQIGWNTTIGWKNWDLNLFFRGVYGHDILNTYRLHYGGRDFSSNTWNTIVVDGPRIEDTPTYNSVFIEKGNFTRLDNVTLGYTPKLPIKEIQSLRVYFTLTNPWISTDYLGVDPEVRYQRAGFYLVPGTEDRNIHFPTRGFTFGLQSRF